MSKFIIRNKESFISSFKCAQDKRELHELEKKSENMNNSKAWEKNVIDIKKAWEKNVIDIKNSFISVFKDWGLIGKIEEGILSWK